MDNKVIKRGDIFYADLAQGQGSEQGGIRPVVIVQNDIGNKFSPTTIVAPITSKLNKAKLPTHIEIKAKQFGLEKDSVMLMEQIRTIDKVRLREFLGSVDEYIIDKIEKNGEIPAHLYELVGVMNEGENENVEQKKNFKEEEILFVKDANSEQINIARQIERNNAVVVQGPPGTGKTHTIANLLGHFLAQGKNVLVTSQTKKALRVLKEKIPKSIQGLCISILDDDNSDMRKSVETISEKLGNFTSEKLGKEVEELEKIQMEEYNNLENINNQMCAIRYKESNSINFNGETFSIQEIAKYLRENSEISEKIPGKISELIACPITNDEFYFGKSSGEIDILAQEIMNMSVKNIENYLKFKMKVFQFIVLILEIQSSTIDGSLISKQAKDLLEEFKISNLPTVKELCEIMNISRYHLEQSFKNYEKIGISEYIQKKKMKYAEMLLISTDKSILEVANEIGYENPSKFSQSFKKYLGILPRKYRNINLEKNNK